MSASPSPPPSLQFDGTLGDTESMTEPLLVDPYAAHAATGIKPGTIRQWLRRGHLTHHGYDHDGRALVDLDELRNRQYRQAA